MTVACSSYDDEPGILYLPSLHTSHPPWHLACPHNPHSLKYSNQPQWETCDSSCRHYNNAPQGLTKEDVDLLLLSGGAARVPKLQAWLQGMCVYANVRRRGVCVSVAPEGVAAGYVGVCVWMDVCVCFGGRGEVGVEVWLLPQVWLQGAWMCMYACVVYVCVRGEKERRVSKGGCEATPSLTTTPHHNGTATFPDKEQGGGNGNGNGNRGRVATVGVNPEEAAAVGAAIQVSISIGERKGGVLY